MKLPIPAGCLFPAGCGKVNNKLRPEKFLSSCFRTGVRFPPPPPNKAVQILRSGRLCFVFFRISRELRTYYHIIFAIILQRWQLKRQRCNPKWQTPNLFHCRQPLGYDIIEQAAGKYTGIHFGASPFPPILPGTQAGTSS